MQIFKRRALIGKQSVVLLTNIEGKRTFVLRINSRAKARPNKKLRLSLMPCQLCQTTPQHNSL
jgi:hypothetical protein